MEEVEGALRGERDYTRLRGGTGPLVYPAGFVYVYAGLRWLTAGSVAAAQPLFAALYCCTLARAQPCPLHVPPRHSSCYPSRQALCLSLFVRTRSLPPAVLPLLCLSKRLHSLYVLRLFNDGVAMLPAFAAVAAAQRARWLPCALLWSCALSVKMNALLLAPPLALVMLQAGASTVTCLAAASAALGLQLLLGLPFLAVHPRAYFGRAFEFGRQFEQVWSVNLQFLSPATFAAPSTAAALLAAHLCALLAFTHLRWARQEGGLPAVLRGCARRLAPGGAPPAPRPLSAAHVATVLLEGNLVGVAFARSLHYQFYAWRGNGSNSNPPRLWPSPSLPFLLTFPGTRSACRSSRGAPRCRCGPGWRCWRWLRRAGMCTPQRTSPLPPSAPPTPSCCSPCWPRPWRSPSRWRAAARSAETRCAARASGTDVASTTRRRNTKRSIPSSRSFRLPSSGPVLLVLCSVREGS